MHQQNPQICVSRMKSQVCWLGDLTDAQPDHVCLFCRQKVFQRQTEFSLFIVISWRCFMSDGMDHFSQRGVNSLYPMEGMFLHCLFNYSVWENDPFAQSNPDMESCATTRCTFMAHLCWLVFRGLAWKCWIYFSLSLSFLNFWFKTLRFGVFPKAIDLQQFCCIKHTWILMTDLSQASV